MKIQRILQIIIMLILLANISILLDIYILRQILSFLFLTFLPGLLLTYALKIKLNLIERAIFSWGLSISILMFVGLIMNNLLLELSFYKPFSLYILLIVYNLVLLLTLIYIYKFIKKDISCDLSFNLNRISKLILIGSIPIPVVSIYGIYSVNQYNSNSLLIFLIFLIVLVIIISSIEKYKLTPELYPIIITLISISLLFMLSLRSNHIIGDDAHEEFLLFKNTLNQMHWSISGLTPLDACISISIVPTIYQVILNINPETLYRILYSALYIPCPLIIYIISKKYLIEAYAFLASCFFMFQINFIFTEFNARTNLAIFFIALSFMTIFNDNISISLRRLLFIIFTSSCILSHYSTTYIAFLVIFIYYFSIFLLNRKRDQPNTKINSNLILIFFVILFFWYGQVIETPLISGQSYIERTIVNLNEMFIIESRGQQIEALFGKGSLELGIPRIIEIIATWLTFLYIFIGVLSMFIRRPPNLTMLEKEPERDYLLFSIIFCGFLLAMIAFPYLARGYDLSRVYSMALIILSTSFMRGAILLGHIVNKRNIYVTCSIMALLLLVPYFLSVTSVTYDLFNNPRSIISNSYGTQYDMYFIEDQESYGAKWVKNYIYNENRQVSFDHMGGNILESQALIPNYNKNSHGIEMENRYTFLRRFNIINDLFMYKEGVVEHILLGNKSSIYNSGNCEVHL